MRSSVAVAVGAASGAAVRWRVGEALATNGFPWGTLLVNLLGCAAIGWVAMRLQRGTVAWYFVVTGVLGGLTTASAFAAETRELAADGRGTSAVLYVVLSIAGGLAAVATTRRWAERPS